MFGNINLWCNIQKIGNENEGLTKTNKLQISPNTLLCDNELLGLRTYLNNKLYSSKLIASFVDVIKTENVHNTDIYTSN